MTAPASTGEGWQEPFSNTGKQVLRDGQHYADACGVREAEMIVAAMNRQARMIEDMADRLMAVRS